MTSQADNKTKNPVTTRTRVTTGKTRIYRQNNDRHKGDNSSKNNLITNWLVIGISGFLLGLFYQKLVVEKGIVQQNGSSSISDWSEDESWKPRENSNQQKVTELKSPKERVGDYLSEKRKNGHGDSFSLGRTVIINGFLKDEEDMHTLANPQIWEELDGDETKWMDADDNNENPDIWQKLAKQIWENHELAQNIAGYEYWCNILDDTKPLTWHVDKDEKLFRQGNETLHYPKMGAVFYGFPHSIKGGYLEIADASVMDLYPTELGGEIERIRAEYNRLVFLNVTNWHRVSAFDGVRYAFAVNIWEKKPMAYL